MMMGEGSEKPITAENYKKGRGIRYTTKQFIAAIPGSGGLLTIISDRVGCNWRTTRRWVDEYPTVLAAYRDECERVLDMTEGEALKAIRAGDGPMIRWYLMMKGKKRGFVERKELTGEGGGPLSVIIEEVSNWRGGNSIQRPDDASRAEDSL